MVATSIGELGVGIGEGLGVGVGVKWYTAVLRPHFVVVVAAVLLWSQVVFVQVLCKLSYKNARTGERERRTGERERVRQ